MKVLNLLWFSLFGILASHAVAGNCLNNFCYERASIRSQFRTSQGDGFWQCEIELSFSQKSGLRNGRGEKPRCGDIPLLQLAEEFRDYPFHSRLLSELGILRKSDYGLLESRIQDPQKLNCTVYFSSRSSMGIREAGDACARAAGPGGASLGD